MICYWRAQLLMSHGPFNTLFLLSLYLRVSCFFCNKAIYLLILISTHWFSLVSSQCLFRCSSKSPKGVFVDFCCGGGLVFFQIRGILNASNSESFHGVNKQLQWLRLHRFKVEEESLNMNYREDRGLYRGCSEWEELDSSSGQMPLLAKAVELEVATLMNSHTRSLIGDRTWE